MKRLYKIYLIIFMSLLTGVPALANEVTAILPIPIISVGKRVHSTSENSYTSIRMTCLVVK